ncbi:MAG: hypothetical protein ACT4O9_13175 [Blastocatellia bacterium]
MRPFPLVWRARFIYAGELPEPELLEGLPAEIFYTNGWSADGKQFAITRGREVRDAVLISYFR